MFRQKVVFYLLIFACLTPFASPLIAFVCGVFLALTVGNPYPEQTPKKARLLLRGSMILLGFGMNLTQVLSVGKTGILFAAAAVFGILMSGFIVGKLLKINGKISALVSSGTLIGGTEAITATAPAIRADKDQTAAAFGVIFILNAAALFVFPLIGHYLNLTEQQFGVWSATAIHDPSAAIGAASKYGDWALQTAVVVKLVIILGVVPVALFFSFRHRGEGENKAKIVVPYFIVLFLLTVTLRTYAPVTIEPSIYDALVNLGKAGLTVTLFLIGAGLSREILAKVSVKPLLQGVILWILLSIVSLWAVLHLL